MKPDFISDYSFFFHSVLSNHTANNHYGRLELDSPGYQTAASLQPLHENSRQEKIEVQILPQVSSSTTACHIVCSELIFFWMITVNLLQSSAMKIFGQKYSVIVLMLIVIMQKNKLMRVIIGRR